MPTDYPRRRQSDIVPVTLSRQRADAMRAAVEGFANLTDDELAQPGIQLCLRLLAERMNDGAADTVVATLGA